MKNIIAGDKTELAFRVLSIILSSIFFANIPLLLFLIYMGNHSFFSYDFFSDGIFGLKVFFIITSAFVAITSLAVFGWIIPLVQKWKKGIFKLWSFIGVVLFNLFFVLIIIVSFPKNGDIFRVAYVLAIGIFITFHISFLIYAEASDQFRSLCVVIFIVTFMSLHLREQASSILAIGLKTYSVGGEIEVTLSPKFKETEPLTGKLMLMSPKHIYIKLGESPDVSTIDRSNFDIITAVKKENNISADKQSDNSKL